MTEPIPITNRPFSRGGHWCWEAETESTAVLFAGKGPAALVSETLGRVAIEGPSQCATLRQVHSNRVLAAQPGCSGEGDALLTGSGGIALAVATADCLPVVLTGKRHLAVVHAGWRGLASRILMHAVRGFEEPTRQLSCWIGPAIGPCCYEVGYEVAERVAAVSSWDAVHGEELRRPHLDLDHAARAQLSELGISDITSMGACTRCSDETLWSYRRDGKGAGRNWTFAWFKRDWGQEA